MSTTIYHDGYSWRDEPLKPCPFCGGEAYVSSVQLPTFGSEYRVRCKNKDCAGHFNDMTAWNEEYVRNHWNTRTPAEYDPYLEYRRDRSDKKRLSVLINDEDLRFIGDLLIKQMTDSPNETDTETARNIIAKLGKQMPADLWRNT